MMAATAEVSQQYSTYALVRRLLVDEALGYWPRYAIAFALMGIAAAATALTAYLLGTMTNEAYVNRNFHGIVVIGVIAAAIFAAKGFATYGSAVTLSSIGNSIIAGNQRRLFNKLLQQDIGFFADRHSSEFIARLTTGAAAVSQVINLLITPVGRDLVAAIALATIYGGYRVIETGATPGAFVSFLAAFLLAYEPAKRLARLNIDLNNNLVGVRVLYEIIDSPPGEPNDDNLPPLELTSARIQFADVHFAYRHDTPVLRGMNFVAQPGAVTALVGPSGGGKSTVLNLLLRFYEADGGQVLIDGQDITSVSRRSLRSEIAYVGQIVHLFRGTIRENIALGKLGASDAEIIAAAKAAHAHDFIMEFPAGYNTPVGEHGLQLSGGQ